MLYDVLSEFLDIVSIVICVKQIILLLSSGVTVLPSSNHLAPSGCPPMAVLHPQQVCHSWIYRGSQIWISKSQISYHRFILCFNMPHHYLHRPLNFSSMPPLSCSSHHASPRGSHVLVRVTHAAVRSSSCYQKLLCQFSSAPFFAQAAA